MTNPTERYTKAMHSALVNDAAVAKLLIEKGIFTMEDYAEAVADEAELEVQRHESRAPRGVHFA